MKVERINFKNSRGLNLVGEFYNADSDRVIIMSHGFTGDKSEWGSFDHIAEGLNKYGFNVFKFDFSGCGESDDDTLSIDKQVDDLDSAINYIRDKGMGKIGLYGHSIGGLVSIMNYSNKIGTMVLTAPITEGEDISDRYSEKQLQELEEKGYLTRTRNKGIRRKFLIDKKMIEDRKKINQRILLESVTCPILIIHGDEDGRSPLEASKRAIKFLPQTSKLEIIKGEGHDFENSLDEIVKLVGGWFTQHLK